MSVAHDDIQQTKGTQIFEFPMLIASSTAMIEDGMENVPDLLSSRPFLILQASSYLSIALVHVALDHQNWKVIKN